MLDDVADELAVDTRAVEIYCEMHGVSLEEMDKDHFVDSYMGHYSEGMEEYAAQMVEDTVAGGDWLIEHGYVAYDKIARDMYYEGWWEEEGHVFCPA